MLKLKLQYFGHLMQRADSLEKTLMLGGIEGRRRRGWQSMRWFDGITDSKDVSLSKLWELAMDREAWYAAVQGLQRVRRDWVTELNWILFKLILPKLHFTLHSRMPGSRWVTTLLWLSKSLRPFLYSSSVYSWHLHLFLIFFASFRSLQFLSFIVLISAGIVPLISPISWRGL